MLKTVSIWTAVVGAAAFGCFSASIGASHGAYPDFAVPPVDGRDTPGLPAVTGRIHVDQFGYLPRGRKVAVVSDPQQGYNAFEAYQPGPKLQVRRRDGTVVYEGAPEPWKNGQIHADSGDRGWWFDFSSVTAPGEYFVFDVSTGRRSPLFRIGNDVYRDVLRAAVRTYYYQRLSTDIREPYAESPWILPPYKDEDKHARAVRARNDPSTERDMSGGWMDAGDTNKYPAFNGDTLSSLLYSYTSYPELFTDDFGIPESGNGLPDLLDEVKFQLEWLVKMQDDDGGVFIKVGNLRNSGGDQRRYYGPKDTGATITFALNTAHAARVYGRFQPWQGFANMLKERAERAWDYYKRTPRTTNLDDGTIMAGSANRSLEDQDRLEAIAAIHLFALTGKPQYQQAIREKFHTLQQIAWGFWAPYFAGISEALIDYTSLPNADPQTVAEIRKAASGSVGHGRFAPPVDSDLYRGWMNPEAYHWGSNSVRASFGFSAILLADNARTTRSERERLVQRGRDMLHWLHGVNPLSVVFLTNMERHGATLSVSRIWHERFNYDTPFASNPPPGYLPGGPNQAFTGTNGNRPGDVEWIKAQPRAKAYADFNETWPKNSWELTENAIYYQAAYIRLLTAVLKTR